MSKYLFFPPLCAAMGLPAPVAEHRFHPVRKWRFDFAFPEYKVALEVEGGLWLPKGGRHNRPMGMVKDFEKYNTAAELGWRVLKVEPKRLMTTATVEMIKRAILQTTK